jgi:TM2 domain-containing membrane protein YozV
MDSFHNPYMSLPGVTAEEIGFLQQAINGLNENQQKYFFMVYSGRRKSPQDMLIFCILGWFVPGMQRFIIGQIGMGILYFFTLGLCFIGTIVDLINHKSLAMEFNKKVAYESYQIAQMGGGPQAY